MSTEPLNPPERMYMPEVLTSPDGREFSLMRGLGGVLEVHVGNRKATIFELWAAWERENPAPEESDVQERVLAPTGGGERSPGTVIDKRDHKSQPTLEGYSETTPQVLV